MNKKILFLVLFIFFIFVGINVEAKEFDFNIIEHFKIADVDTNKAEDDDGYTTCEGYFGSVEDESSLMHLMVVYVFRPIRWLTPIILIFFTTLDFGKVVFADSKDGMEKAKKNFVKRAMIAVVIFFIPTLLQLIFNVFDSIAIDGCMDKFN